MKALFVRMGFLGDILLSTASLKATKKKHPNTEIHFGCWMQCSEIVALNEHVSKIVCPGYYFMSDYDIWIDLRHESLMDKYPETYWGKLHAIQCHEKGLLDIDQMEGDFKPETYIGPDDIVEREDNSKICTINVFSANGRNWRLWEPFDKWTELVMNLHRMGYKVVQLGGNDDPRIGGVDVQLCGRTRLAQVPGVLAVSDLAIGIDSFMMHCCHADKFVHNTEDGTIGKIADSTPSVLICGPVPWQCVVPRDAKCVPVFDHPDCDGFCNHSYSVPGLEICRHENSCMRELSIQRVLEAIEEVRRKHCE